MPLILDNPQTLTLAEVKITSFQVYLAPELSVCVQYVIGDPSEFAPVQIGSATFGAAEIAKVDPSGSVTDGMKDALYALLETRLGPGQVT